MEFKRVVGTRRTIRFFKPWKPVERAKIQVMLEAANRSSRSINADYPKAVVVNRDDLPMEIRDALNAAVDEGLGVALHAFTSQEVIKEYCKVPDIWQPTWLMLVGYPAEDPEAGGHGPPRPPAPRLLEGSCDNPWQEDPEVTEYLKREGMIQRPGPLPWRQQEVRMLSRMFGLPE